MFPDCPQLFGGNTNDDKTSSSIMRERAVRACASKLEFCARDFEESLFALHQEVDHLGPDNDANRCHPGPYNDANRCYSGPDNNANQKKEIP